MTTRDVQLGADAVHVLGLGIIGFYSDSQQNEPAWWEQQQNYNSTNTYIMFFFIIIVHYSIYMHLFSSILEQ